MDLLFSDGTVERRGGFLEHKSLQEIDVQMFLEILLANHLHVMVVDFLWKLLVAQSYRDGAVTSSRPSGYTSLIQCVILCAKHLPRQMRRCTSYAQTVKLGHP